MVADYNEILGPVWPEFEFGGPVYADTFPWAVVGLLGDYATTGTGAPFAHTAAVLNSTDGQPKAYSITDFYDLTGGTPARRYAGLQFSEVGLKFDASGLLTYDAKTLGLTASTQVAKPTQSFTAVTPHPVWEGTLTIAGGAIAYIEAGTLVMKRPITPIHAIDGSAAPYRAWAGPVSVTGTYEFIVEDDAELTRYLTNTQPASVLTFTHGAAALTQAVSVTMTKTAYTIAKLDRGKDYVKYMVSFTAIANTTDVGASGGYSPCKWTMTNAVPASTYA
jgi:hypothetical protein